MTKITKRLVDSLRPDPGGKELMVWDSELKGFGVRVQPSGVASYFVFYRTAEGRQRKLTLGRVGVLTPDQARQMAREALAEAARGGDPSAERHKLRRAITVAELCDQYLAAAEGRVKASTLAMDRSRIERHVKPLIGRRAVPALTQEDVERLRDDIIAGRTAAPRVGRGGVTTGGKGVAAHTVVMLGTILEFARKRGIVAENVARGVERPPATKKTRFLSADEMRRLGAAMRAEGEGRTGVNAVRFLLLSGCRRKEALSLRVDWIDRAAGCIRFPDTKTGPQVRPIGQAALAVLPQRGEWAFPSARTDGHFVGVPRVVERLCRRAEIEDVETHTLRYSFASVAAELGFSELTIAGLLGHKIPGVTARYAHVPDRALVAAADRVSARIAEALGP